jgi:REP element-mobilizing transposase RayT
MGSGQSIDKIVMLLKGESSYWINRNYRLAKKFEWQKQYFALSVSESIIERVRNYIKRQEVHHRKKPFDEEYREYIRRYGFSAFISG